jgi:hypothetical protein
VKRRLLMSMLALAVMLAAAPIAAAQATSWPTERPPRPLPSKRVSFPEFKLKTLSNGLQVIAVSQNELRRTHPQRSAWRRS